MKKRRRKQTIFDEIRIEKWFFADGSARGIVKTSSHRTVESGSTSRAVKSRKRQHKPRSEKSKAEKQGAE
jgi:hypothetical protein